MFRGVLRRFELRFLCLLIVCVFLSPQSLYEEAAANERSEGDAEELLCLPQTQKLEVVATVH